MKMCNKFVGWTQHQDTIAIAVSEASAGSARYYGEIANTLKAMTKLVKTLTRRGTWSRFAMGPVRVAMGSIGDSRSLVRPARWWPLH